MVESVAASRYVFVAVFTANIAGFLTGTTLSWSSPVIPLLTQDTENPLGRIITYDEQSWIGSLPALGAIFSPQLFAYLGEKLGRKPGIYLIGIPFLAAYLTLAFSKTIVLYYIARFLCGVGIGGTFTLIPMYIGEVADVGRRGFLASSTTAFIQFGILFPYAVGPYVSIMVFNIILSIFPALLVVAILFLAPESPYYLVSKFELKLAYEALRKLRGDQYDVDKELEEIKESISGEEKASLLTIFKTKAGKKAFVISAALTSLQQFSGINIILAYTETIFRSTGSTSIDPALSSLIVGAVMAFTSYITPIGSDRLGRRFLLLFSITGVLVTQAVFGLYFYLMEENHDVSNISWLPITTLVLYIILYNSGFGSLPFVTMGELFPLNAKSVGSAVVSSLYWIVGFLLTFFFNSITDTLGTGQCFWIFSGICVFTLIFVYFFVIETKNKSLQEIQDILNGHK